ncbi:DUF4349 domain-containing protein [Streptomyces sp. SCSIO 30461]|uniref:DUF4349 domain-containing protein n=1 Tax=Streptomyces sp. SCSIO 30461 TaxID=3118085 RepID=UPI0030D14079
MRVRRHTVAAALLTASLALAGCSASDGSSGDAKSAARHGAADAAPGRGPAAESGYAAASPAPGAQRDGTAKKPAAGTHIIRTAELSVEVKDATKALARVRTTVETAGGHVADETTERVDDTRVASRIVLRVPQDRYASLLTDLEGSGKLLSRKADAEDVTDQVVDVESRIATQRASVARVRALMDRAEKLADVVTLEGELSRRQSELESLLAQQASLKDRTSMATITLSLSEAYDAKPAVEDDPGFLDALKGGWDALAATVRWIGLVLGAVVPFAAVAAVLYALWRLLVRPLRLRRRPGTAAADAPAGPQYPLYPGKSEQPE